jgi:hypothetical protein
MIMSMFSPQSIAKIADQITVQKDMDISDLHIPTLESAWSLAYRQDPADFVADQVFPVFGVNQITGKYARWSLGNFTTPMGEAWRPSTMLPQGELNLDDRGDFECIRYALEAPLPVDLPEVQDKGMSVEMATTYLITDALRLKREINFATKYFVTSVWGNTWTGAASGESGTSAQTGSLTFRQFNDYDNSDPLMVFKDAKLAAKKLTLRKPNVALMGEQVYEELRIHPQLTNLYRNPQGADKAPTKLNEAMLAQALDLDKIIVGKAMYNTAAPGATASLDWVFGKHILVAYVGQPGIMTQMAGMNFSFNTSLGGYDTAVRQVPDLRTLATYYQGFQCYTQKIVSSGCGVMLLNAMA